MVTNARRPKDHALLFLQQFLKHPREVASITPSSRFVERRLVDLAGIASARSIVELGCGTGGTTRAMLAAMRADARLLAIDVNPRFCALLAGTGDARLAVHRGGAHELREALSRHDFDAPDAIVSGIPFSAIDRRAAVSIIETIWASLAADGRFVAYQVRDHVDRLSRGLLGPPHSELVLANVPPVRVYRWHKRDGVAVLADRPARARAH
jgi:phospholipid N-methyltransferase